MKMCDKEIGFLDAKLFKGTLQRLLTLRAVEAGINEQILLARDDVGIDTRRGLLGSGTVFL